MSPVLCRRWLVDADDGFFNNENGDGAETYLLSS